MADLYRLLGLSRRAEDAAIKASYLRLAKRFHPDANPDLESDNRFKEINRAYETLGNPEARAAYDLEQGSRRSHRRRQFWAGILTGLTTFALTLGTLPTLTKWAQQKPAPPSHTSTLHTSEPTQTIAARTEPDCQEPGASAPEHRSADASAPDAASRACATDLPPKVAPRPQVLVYLEREELAYARDIPEPGSSPHAPLAPRSVVLEAAPAIKPKPARWTLLENAKAGFELKYPADVFQPRAGDKQVDDRLFTSGDGHAVLRIYANRSNSEVSLTKYRASLLAQRYVGASLDYAPLRNQWFVLSGTVGEEMFYERVSFSCDGRAYHGWLLTYPVAERQFYDAVVEEMHRSYRYGRIMGWQCNVASTSRKGARTAPEANETVEVPPL